MDYVWTPWRYQYLKQAESGEQPECFFCDAVQRTDDEKTLVVYRGKRVFIILNRFPYTSGHVMIVPYAHVGDLSSADPEALAEMMQLAPRVETKTPAGSRRYNCGSLARAYDRCLGGGDAVGGVDEVF